MVELLHVLYNPAHDMSKWWTADRVSDRMEYKLNNLCKYVLNVLNWNFDIFKKY